MDETTTTEPSEDDVDDEQEDAFDPIPVDEARLRSLPALGAFFRIYDAGAYPAAGAILDGLAASVPAEDGRARLDLLEVSVYYFHSLQRAYNTRQVERDFNREEFGKHFETPRRIYYRCFLEKLPWTIRHLIILYNWRPYSQDYETLIPATDHFFEEIVRFRTAGELNDELLDLIIASYIPLDIIGDAVSPKQRYSELFPGANINGCNAPLGEQRWARVLLRDLTNMPEPERARWIAVFNHAGKGKSARPDPKWLAAAQKLIEAIGHEHFERRYLGWVGRVDAQSYKDSFWSTGPEKLDRDSSFKRGMIWLAALLPGAKMAPLLARAAEHCYRKVGPQGMIDMKAGNACLIALENMEGLFGVAEIAKLRLRVKHQGILKTITKALETTAKRVGVTPEDLEEIVVPTCDLDGDGVWRAALGDVRVEIALAGAARTEMRYVGADGKALKSLPAAIKESHAAELKLAKAAQKDIDKTLSGQRSRLDMLLRVERSWPYAIWRERYLGHPILRHLGTRLIWWFRDGARNTLGIHRDGVMVDVDGNAIHWLGEKTTVSLWHPITVDEDVTLAWRDYLIEYKIAQPIKQAFRELYAVTEAELRTNTYSNRFAAHIIKQMQFNALAHERLWKFNLQTIYGYASGQYGERPTLVLPSCNLSAELTVQRVEGNSDDFGTGDFLKYISTNQVRFLTDEDRIIAMKDVPVRVFSEVMRDIDMFVSVCSIGNDPQWHDTGDQPQLRDYWHNYQFADLSGSGENRKAILERLVPRLKIKDRCSFDGKFLVVRGDLRTYKIHLGSSSIQMSPNDRYLCIVPSSKDPAKAGDVLLPFEGDTMLAVILAKAFLLADDTKIKDPTIVSQIKSGNADAAF